MISPSRRRTALAALVFTAVLFAHFAWFALRGPHTRWISLDDDSPGLPLAFYLESGSVWLGLSYALALSFAAVWLDRYREERFCAARTLSIGGVTLSGFLAVAGCYALGCCGSPMLAVYLSLFGTAFLPLTKPLVFVFTAVSLSATWWWMTARQATTAPPRSSCDATIRVPVPSRGEQQQEHTR